MSSRLDLAAASVLALWLGASMFFSFVSAPAVFRVLPREEAGRVVGAIFPAYHGIGIGASALYAGLMVVRAARVLVPGGVPGAVLAAGMLAVAALNGTVVHRHAHRLRERIAVLGGPEAQPVLERAFRRTHALSMALNLAALLLGLASGAMLFRR